MAEVAYIPLVASDQTTLSARVLIVDDEQYNRDVLEQELEFLGYDPVLAEDGRCALDRLAAEPIDLVLLDIMMPALNGYEVLRRIRADAERRHVPVIMISAVDDLDSVIRCIELGAEDYLPKPFDPVLLKARIGACLEKKRWHDQEAAYLRQIRQQMEDVERERERADRLMHVILPARAVAELRATERVVPRRYEEVAVLFADIVGFTPYCDTHAPEEVVANLGHLIEACEQVMAVQGLEKIKTIGDCVMATANLLLPIRDPVMAAVRSAFAMRQAARGNPAGWELRVGIHVGPVVAGIVGRSKFAFDLWGDTVNVAARLSSLGKVGAVHVTGDAWARLAGRCRGDPLGPVSIKGKGEMEVYRCDQPET